MRVGGRPDGALSEDFAEGPVAVDEKIPKHDDRNCANVGCVGAGQPRGERFQPRGKNGSNKLLSNPKIARLIAQPPMFTSANFGAITQNLRLKL